MSKPELKIVKPSTEAEKHKHTVNDTIEVTPNGIRSWKLPPFQRSLRVNQRVMDRAAEIKSSGIIPGTVTLGIVSGDDTVWLVDGQHRLHAFLLAEIPVGYADVRWVHVKTMAELAREYKALNSRLVNMKPDDFLKSLESSSTVLQKVRKHCPYVGYDSIRRSEKAPILSMSTVIRNWSASSKDSPTNSSHGGAVDVVESMSGDDADVLIKFLAVAIGAWGRDPEYARLWGSLNLSLCMWLYRRVVHGHGLTSLNVRTTRLDDATFGKCLMSLSADSAYLDWLVGRQSGERDRSPAYGKIKSAFAARMESDTGRKPVFPQPAWAHHIKKQ